MRHDYVAVRYRGGTRLSGPNVRGFVQQLLADLEAGRVARVPGTAVFLTRSAAELSAHSGRACQMHGRIAAQCDRAASGVQGDTAGRRRSTLDHRAGRRRYLACGDLLRIRRDSGSGPGAQAIKDLDPSIDLEHAIYFGTRDLVVRKPGSTLLGRARLVLFAFLYRNAVKVVDRFHLPASNVVEIARLVAI